MVCFKDVAPSVALCFCIEASALHGRYDKNPLRFINPLYSELVFEHEGVKYPTNGMDFDNSMSHDPSTAQCKEAYNNLFTVLQQQYGAANHGLQYEDFLAGSTIIAVQLSGK